jgi:tetratricopeptide (TPR) repeat protein
VYYGHYMRSPGLLWALAFLAGAHEASSQTGLPAFQNLARQAGAARDARQLDKAMSLYQQALKLKPDWEEGLWNLGSITYDLDRYAECAPAFRKLAAVKPDSAPAWTMAGLCEYKLRRFDEAMDSLGHVETLKFQEPAELAHSARLHFALVLTKTGNFEKAVAVLTELTRIDHKSPETIAAAGIAGLRRPWLPFEVPEGDRELVFKLGDAMATAMEFEPKEAVRKFEELVQQYPSEPNVHFRFGAYLNTQDSNRAIEEIGKALTLAPDHLPALVGLAAIHLKREETDVALEYAERAVKANANDFSAHLILGRVLLAKEDPAHAATELEQAVKFAPVSVEAHYSLASAYSRLGRKDDAARELAEFRRLQNLLK